jgi:hypothetical protein
MSQALNYSYMKMYSIYSIRTLALLLVAVFTLSARVDNHPDDVEAQVKNLTGTYSVSDKRQVGIESKHYSITITKSMAGIAAVEVANFGNIMYAPVRAVIHGNNIYIEPQLFRGKKMSITVSGSGTFNNKGIQFDYVIDTGKSHLAYRCKATKN